MISCFGASFLLNKVMKNAQAFNIFWLVRFLYIFEFAHEGCLYLIKNKVKTEIFWIIIIANLKEKFNFF